ncbi:MAG: DUF2490 domain-containing protein [Ferruginibacter sp.]
MRRIFIVALYIMTTKLMYGQKNIINQQLMWYGYFTTFNINKNWYFQNELQERHYIKPVAQHQFLIRGHVHRLLGKSGWETSVGMCLFLQNANDPNSTSNLTVPELRPHIEFAYKRKFAKITIDHMYRAEARFFHNKNSTETELEDGFDFGNFRFRYRLQATIPIIKMADERFIKVKISDEIHLNAGNKISTNVFDQNRIYGGISYDLSQKTAIDMGYLNWFQQRSNGDFFNRNILRFSFFHKIDLQKKSE